MAQKTLQAVVVLGGRVDNSFGQIGSALIDMGSTINEVSQQLIDFGKDSVDVYRNYEDSMLDAQVALSTTYGRGTRELQAVMAELDARATEWAATTIFHTNDVGNAIAQAAHAGWDFDKILSGIPAAMQLAQAGGLDLSQAVDYIIKSVNAAGISFGDMGTWIDEWTYAANRSAGDVQSFGDAMLRMGSTMRFTDSKEELLTLIAIMHDSGAVGTEAGTLIRNSLIRLIAPTDKAKEAFQELGATSEETAGMVEDEALAMASAKLEAAGFSPVDEQGNIKPVLQMYRELSDALAQIAGGYENISSNGEALEILSAIFPTRTITGALAFINAVHDNFGGLYDDLIGGSAEDYGGYASETMMSGLTGAIETFGSKVERLKQLVGEELAPQVTAVTGWAGDFVDSIATMDDGKFSALVSGLEVVAGSGTALLTVGAGLRLIGRLLTPTGLIAAGVLTATALAAAFDALDEARFESNFGTMGLDTETLSSYVQTLGEDFNSAYQNVDAFRAALDKAVESYKTASTEFSSRMLTDMLTGKELTEDDLKVYQGYGQQMVTAVLTGLQNSADMSAEYWAALMSGHGDDPKYAADPTFQSIIGIIQSGYDSSVGRVMQIGEDLKSAITAAFDPQGPDGNHLTPEEQQNILDYFNELNEFMAKAEKEAQTKQAYIERQALLYKGQTLSYDAMADFIEGDVASQRQSELDKSTQMYYKERAGLEYDYDEAIKNAETEDERRALEARKANDLSVADAAYKNEQAGIYATYDKFIFDLFESTMASSDLAETDKRADELAAAVRGGFMSRSMATGYFDEEGKTKVRDTYKMYQDLVDWMGGETAVQDRITYYAENGNAEMAAQLQNMYDKYGMARAVALYVPNGQGGQGMASARGRDWREDYTYQYSLQSAEDMRDWVDTMAGLGITSIQDFFQAVGSTQQLTATELSAYEYAMSSSERSIMDRLVERLSGIYDFDTLLAGSSAPQATEGNAQRDYYAAWMLMNMGNDAAERYRYGSTEYTPTAIAQEQENISQLEAQLAELNASIASHETSLQTAWRENPWYDLQGGKTADETALNGTAFQPGLYQQRDEVEAELEAARARLAALGVATQEAEPATMKLTYEPADEENRAQLTEAISPLDVEITYPNATENAQDVHGQIAEQFKPITQTITITTRQGAEQITASPGGGGGGFTYLALQAYKLGGRATEPSIFGEGETAEWAIPEAHTPETASLLMQAADASGFTWGELAESSGESSGGGGGSSGSVFHVEYSPIIHADNAQGVDKVLKEDKKRLKRMLEELLAERELYESVVRYQ